MFISTNCNLRNENIYIVIFSFRIFEISNMAATTLVSTILPEFGCKIQQLTQQPKVTQLEQTPKVNVVKKEKQSPQKSKVKNVCRLRSWDCKGELDSIHWKCCLSCARVLMMGISPKGFTIEELYTKMKQIGMHTGNVPFLSAYHKSFSVCSVEKEEMKEQINICRIGGIGCRVKCQNEHWKCCKKCSSKVATAIHSNKFGNRKFMYSMTNIKLYER